MKITSKEINPQHFELSIALAHEDYNSKFNSQISKIQRDGNFKGFRKGKAPASLVKKMHGESILLDVLFKELDNSLNSYIKEEKLNLFGQPIPTNEEAISIALDQPKEYNFTFEIGVMPEWGFSTLDASNTLPFYEVIVEDEMIDKEMEHVLNQRGSLTAIEGQATENETIDITGHELDDKGALVENGNTINLRLTPASIENEEIKNQLIGAEKGKKFTLNTADLKGNLDDESFKKQILQLEDDQEAGLMYEAIIDNILTHKPAEISEDLLKSTFGEEVTTEEQARDVIKEHLSRNFSRISGGILFDDIKKELIKENEGKVIPDTFLKKWLKYNNEELGDEEIEKNIENFKKDLLWEVLFYQLRDKYNVRVSRAEVEDYIYYDFSNRLQAGMSFPKEILKPYIDKEMQNEQKVKNISDMITAFKLETEFISTLSLDKKGTSLDDANEMYNARFNNNPESTNEEIAE